MTTSSIAVATPRRRLAGRWFRMLRAGAVMIVALLVLGNAGILLATAVARRSHAPVAPASIEGIRNFATVDARVWRGGAPSNADAYRALAAAGVTTIVDLRAEEWVRVDDEMLAGAGLTRFEIPIRDGQTPTPAQVEEFLAIARDADGIVFVHCGAGVGRSGSMSAAYLVSTGQASPSEAVQRNLAIGPPSLEQIAWVNGLEAGEIEPTGAITTILSRVIDGPRRIWHTLGF